MAYFAPTPSLISPLMLPRTVPAPPIIFLATSPVWFKRFEPVSLAFLPNSFAVAFTDSPVLFIAFDAFVVMFCAVTLLVVIASSKIDNAIPMIEISFLIVMI